MKILTGTATILLGLVMAAPWFPAPRAAIDSTASQPGPRATDSIGVSAQAPARASGRSLPEAPGPFEGSSTGASLSKVGSVALGGVATWYDAPSGSAAAGPALRELLGPGWRGQVVTVTGPDGDQVSVELRDRCACGMRSGHDTLLDLDDVAFAKANGWPGHGPTGPFLSAGVIEVTVETTGGHVLPATDTAP